MSLFDVKKLTLGYQSKQVIQGLSFSLDKPFLFVLGANGIGKTTFLKAIAGLVPYVGSILSHNKAMDEVPVSICLQNNSLSQDLLVKDILLMGLYRDKKMFQSFSSVDDATIQSAAKSFHITHLLDQYYFELSGGQQKMVWICQSFIHKTSLVLLDEPTNSLDARFKKRLVNYLKNSDRTIICATHDFDFIAELPNAQYLILQKEKHFLTDVLDIPHFKSMI